MSLRPTYMGPAIYGNKKNYNGKSMVIYDVKRMLINGREVEYCPNIKHDIDLINESLYRLLNTEVGERVYLRDFGCNLRRYLFEPLDSILKDNIREDVWSSIRKWEPRVKVEDVSVIQTADHSLSVDLVYTIIFDKKYTVSLTVYTN